MPAHHTFADHTFTEPTWCELCQRFLFGFRKQGKRCSQCFIALHKRCCKELQGKQFHRLSFCTKNDRAKKLTFLTTKWRIEVYPNLFAVCLTLIKRNRKFDDLIISDSLLINLYKDSQHPDRLSMIINGKDEPQKFDMLFDNADRKVEELEHLCALLSMMHMCVPWDIIPLGPQKEDITVWVSTWNMGERPPPATLTSWLPQDPVHHLLCICVEDCLYDPGNPKNAVAGTVEQHRKVEEHFKLRLDQHVGSYYTLVAHQSIFSIRMFVYVRKVDAIKVSHKRTCAVDLPHSKQRGAVAIAFSYNLTPLVFIGAQFADMHDNNSYRTIVKGCQRICWNGMPITTCYEYVFWSGDFSNRSETRYVGSPIEASTMWGRKRAHSQHSELATFTGFVESVGDLATRKNPYIDTESIRETFEVDFDLSHMRGRIFRRAIRPESCEEISFYKATQLPHSDHAPVCGVYRIKTSKQYLFSTDMTKSNPTHYARFQNGCQVQILKLSASKLIAGDVSGKSDPYVKFYASFLNDPVQTSTISRNLNPVWSESHLPKMYPFYCDPAYIESCILWMRVLDQDRYNQDDDIGSVGLPLDGMMDGEEHSFDLPLDYKGAACGSISGKIRYIKL